MAQRKKILVIDDSRTAVMMVRTILSKEDLDIVVAVDGREGVDKALAEHPDVILLDVVMPRLDGFGACKELRAHPTTRDIPVILVTTRGEAENVEHGFEAGCSDFVTKPINSLELLTKVKNFL